MLQRITFITAVVAALLTTSCTQVRFVEQGAYEVALVSDTGKSGEAQTTLGKTLEQQSARKPVAEYRADVQRALGALEEAAAVPQLPPKKRAALYYDQGLCHLLLENSHEARACFDHASRLAPLESRYAVMAQHAYFQEVDGKFDDVNKRLAAEIATATDTLAKAQDADFAKIRANLDNFVEGVARDLSNQNAILDRAVGKYIPIKIPEGLEQELANLEAVVKTPATRPSTQKEVETRQAQLSLMRKSIPPWAEKELFPRFSSLEWMLGSLALLCPRPNEQLNNEQTIARAEEFLNRTPDDAPSDIAGSLSMVVDKARQAIAQAQFDRIRDRRNQLGDNPPIPELAKALTELDNVQVEVEEMDLVRQFKEGLTEELRKRIREEVLTLQKDAVEISITSCSKAMDRHARAAQLLAYYPMSERSEAVSEVQELLKLQAGVASQIEAVRRQRYNAWSVEQVQAAFTGYDNNSSSIPYHTDETLLTSSLVKCIGTVDPSLLDPVPLSLYNAIVEKTMDKISSQGKQKLAQSLADPQIKRKTLGDF